MAGSFAKSCKIRKSAVAKLDRLRNTFARLARIMSQIGQNNEPDWPDWHVKVAWQTLTQSNEKIQGCVSYMILLRVSNSLAHTILSNNGLPC